MSTKKNVNSFKYKYKYSWQYSQTVLKTSLLTYDIIDMIKKHSDHIYRVFHHISILSIKYSAWQTVTIQ